MNMKLKPGSPREAGMSEGRVRRILDLTRGWVAQGVTPALVILVARRGVIVIHEAFGRLTPQEDSPPLERDTLFPLSSLTKPITATAIMILVEDGLLGLNRPVSWYIPEFVGEGKDAVMVHHLLTHTSGIGDEEVFTRAEERRAVTKLPPPDETQHPYVHEWLYHVYDVPLSKPPGTVMVYSTWGYELLGEIVRRVSGQSLAGFCQERIFQSLGMKDTFFIVPEAMKGRVVRHMPDREDARQGLILGKIEETPWACGGVYSTALNMAIFGQMYLNRGRYGDVRVLSPASVAEMTRDQIPGLGAWWGDEFFPEALWGLGWNIRGNAKFGGSLWSPQTFSHYGTGAVRLWVDPVYEIVGAYFSVASKGGIPPGIRVPEGLIDEGEGWWTRMDLLINMATAAVVDI